MKITRDEIIHVANLARLHIDDGEVEKLACQIGNILEYVDMLERIDTSGVEPTTHTVSLTNALRDDVPVEHSGVEKSLANAPEKENDFFVVPKVLG